MPGDKTHRVVKDPTIEIRFLSEYMAGSDRARRAILRNSKYPPIARVVQHDEAQAIVEKAIRSGGNQYDFLTTEAAKIRNRLASDQFERDLYDHNADYIARFAQIAGNISLPEADVLAPGPRLSTELEGTKVRAQLRFRLRRLTKTNKVRVGAGTLRYAKGKPLGADVGDWQSAILFGLLSLPGMIEAASEPERKLCITLCAQSGAIRSAPTDSISRFKNATAACATIADAWPNVKPPPNAIL